jgi:hypothetical protein
MKYLGVKLFAETTVAKCGVYHKSYIQRVWVMIEVS